MRCRCIVHRYRIKAWESKRFPEHTIENVVHCACCCDTAAATACRVSSHTKPRMYANEFFNYRFVHLYVLTAHCSEAYLFESRTRMRTAFCIMHSTNFPSILGIFFKNSIRSRVFFKIPFDYGHRTTKLCECVFDCGSLNRNKLNKYATRAFYLHAYLPLVPVDCNRLHNYLVSSASHSRYSCA